MGTKTPVWQVGLLAAVFGLALACSGSSFSGGTGKKSASLTDNKKNKGDPEVDGPGGDPETDPNGDPTDDGDNPEGGPGDEGDNGNPGELGEDGDTPGDKDGDGIPDEEDPDPEIPNDDDDETSLTTRSDLTVQQTQEDEKHSVKVELLIGGNVAETAQQESPGKGKSLTFTKMCRKGKDTCLRVTFIGKITQTAPANCILTEQTGGNSATMHVDTNGQGMIGTCREANKDETHIFTCTDSKSLKVENCNG